jgi:Zn-dependent M28 family amino/carboxypeptidase
MGYFGNVEAASYLYNRLSNISGLSVEYQGDYKNIVATLPGVDPTSNATYILGAHYDSFSSNLSDSPGATDDGGGVAIVLEFARIMS